MRTRLGFTAALAAIVMFTIGAGMAVAQEQPPSETQPPPDVANEYRITAYPSYRINETWSGFGYVGWVLQAGCGLLVLLPGKGRLLHPPQLAAGLGWPHRRLHEQHWQERSPGAAPVCRPQVHGEDRAEVALLQLDPLRAPPHGDARHGRMEDGASAPQPDPHRNPSRLVRKGLDAEVVVRAGGRRAHLPLRHGPARPAASACGDWLHRQSSRARGIPVLRPGTRTLAAAGSRTRTTSSA